MFQGNSNHDGHISGKEAENTFINSCEIRSAPQLEQHKT